MANKINLEKNYVTTPLYEYYLPLDEISKKQFKAKVVSKLGICESTFYRWISGRSKPSRLEAEAIAELCGIPAPTLYPHHYVTLT